MTKISSELRGMMTGSASHSITTFTGISPWRSLPERRLSSFVLRGLARKGRAHDPTGLGDLL